MIIKKTAQEIEKMAAAGAVLVKTMNLLAGKVRPGVSTASGTVSSESKSVVSTSSARPAMLGAGTQSSRNSASDPMLTARTVSESTRATRLPAWSARVTDTAPEPVLDNLTRAAGTPGWCSDTPSQRNGTPCSAWSSTAAACRAESSRAG